MTDSGERLINAIHTAVRQLSATASVEETLWEVLEVCLHAADAEAGSIYIHDPVRRRLEFRYVLPDSLTDKLPADIPDDFGIAGEVFQSRTAKITEGDAGAEARQEIERQTEVRVRSMLTVPLCVPDGEAYGVVQLINKRGGSFTELDLDVFGSVGAVSAMATANSMLVEHVGRTASLMGMGNVAHDIANLAGALRSHLYLVTPLVEALEGGETKDDLLEAVGELEEVTVRLERYGHLIADISAGRPVRVSKTSGCLGSAVERAASYLEPMARRENCSLAYEVHRGEHVMFDAIAIHRIVENLVTNAIKAVKEGAGERKVTLSLRPADDKFVLEVSDNGPGMNEFTVRRILEGNAVSAWTASSGTGLGTKVVRELVAALGGHMEIESSVGTGTTFRVFIPSERVNVAS